ncbi:hypothetical protein [Actimicrobium antarcticum]|uniref:Uncharacterized protein n=1 Tax=Actimicrobium antarcticum TaxID=1051899 RepID=A0ABP7TDB2_9BURK
MLRTLSKAHGRNVRAIDVTTCPGKNLYPGDEIPDGEQRQFMGQSQDSDRTLFGRMPNPPSHTIASAITSETP